MTGATFQAVDPTTGAAVDGMFAIASRAEVAAACRAADASFDVFRELAPAERAGFLDRAADELTAIGEPLVDRAMRESGLPEPRLRGELARTANQLRLFARVLRDGDWAGVVFDPALPDRVPPRPGLRQRRIAIGPVAVFGASNFPLAFSAGGGDTASALAAGCPVVVKGHPSHPGTSALVAEAFAAAAAACGLPTGIFALLQGTGNDLGAALVQDPHVKAVGFTGSRRGGLALIDLANRRPEPIPVFAEMSSVNPVLLLPAALDERAEALGAAYVASLTLGAGQFCTNPGIVLAVAGPALDRFVAAAARAMESAPAQVMLTAAIHRSFADDVAAFAARAGVRLVAQGLSGDDCRGRAALFETGGEDVLADPALCTEIFGAASLIVHCASLDELRAVLAAMEGQLTATVQMADEDVETARTLLPLLERKAGRILANGWPTGVEVSHAMVHGGPFPATSDPRMTSVGAAAIERFLRPVCYQDLPEALLPQAIRSDNPLGLPRRIS